ncbi:MAG TPA: hypothetical protein VFJ47_05150 [Terriglobales bacterium]|nr:hypothetical protein [Terriglobales bacterium]
MHFGNCPGLDRVYRNARSNGILWGMKRGSIWAGLAVLAILCTLAILLFPVARGPYPVTHGPVTSLRVTQAGFLLWLSIAFAGLSLLRLPRAAFSVGARQLRTSGRLDHLRFTPDSSILRC